MARIAFAWELGGEFGHVMACAVLARGLSVRGHTIAFMFRELRQLAFLPEVQTYDMFQAPHAAREGENAQLPASYADILLGCGYGDSAELTGLVGGWRSLIERWAPDMVIADFAPTAMLATRTLGRPCVTYGNGFFVPPHASPLPAFRFDEVVPAERLARSDARALANVNAAFARFGTPPLARLIDMFDCEEHFLCTFPEIDHYGTREKSGYWGPRMRFDRGAEVAWPAGRGKRVFVYVKRHLPQLDALIDVLAASPHRIIAFIPDLDPKRRARLEGRGRVVSEKPLKLDSVLRECDLMIAHGGELATGALMYGVPTLLFPGHYEQYITARRLDQIGCGAWYSPSAAAKDIARGLSVVLGNPAFVTNCRAFARRYGTFSPAEQRRRIVQRVEEMLGGAILSPSSTSQGPQR